MSISGVGSYQTSSYAVATTSVKASTKSSEALFANSLAAQKKTDAENKLDQTSDIWGELSQEYDIRNATFDQFCEVANSLYDVGQISSFERAYMTLSLDKLRQYENDITVSSFYATPASSDGKRDWIAEYEARLRRDPLHLTEQKQNILKALRHLDI